MVRSCFLCAVMTLACVAIASPASALPPEERDWEVQASLYGWMASIDATVSAAGVTRDFEVDFKDILEDLGWAVMGNVEGRWKRGLVIVDTVGMQVVSDLSGGPRTRPFAGPGGMVTGDLKAGEFDVHTRLTIWILDTKLGVRALSFPITKITGSAEVPGDLRHFDVDLFAGMRYWNITNKIGLEVQPAALTVNGVPTPLPGVLPEVAQRNGVRLPPQVLRDGTDKNKQETTDWVDPIIGMRLRADITKRWSLFVLGDVGGWNIGSASDLTWQGMIGSRFAVSEHWGFQTGYRALGVDKNDTFESTIMHGPQIGAFVRF